MAATELQLYTTGREGERLSLAAGRDAARQPPV